MRKTYMNWDRHLALHLMQISAWGVEVLERGIEGKALLNWDPPVCVRRDLCVKRVK